MIGIAALLLVSSATSAEPARESLAAAADRGARELARTAPLLLAPQSQNAWGRVHALDTGARVRVITLEGASAEGRLERATEDVIVIAAGDARPPVEFRRETVARVQRQTKGSLLGGVLGVAAGALAGVVTAANLAMKECGESCSDEKALIALSLVGMPIAGGYAGATLMPRASWTNVYERR